MILHRIGDTFHADLTYTDEAGAAQNLTDLAITPGGLVYRPGADFSKTISAKIANQNASLGGYSLTADTGDWSEGDALFVAQYTDASGHVSSTDPVHILLTLDTSVGDPGDSTMDVTPILAAITVPSDRTAIIPEAPPAQAAALFSAPIDPGDRRLLVIDFSTALGADGIASIEWIGFDAAAAALGFRIATGTRRPILDTANKRIGVYVECDPAYQQATVFAGTGLLASIRVRIVIANTLSETLERSAPFIARQL